MRRPLYILIAILAVLLSSKFFADRISLPDGEQDTEAVPSIVAEESDEYAVFSAVIDERYSGTGKLVVIRDYAGGCNAVGYELEDESQTQDLPADLYREYRVKNRECMNLASHLDLSIPKAHADFSMPYTFISDEEMKALELKNSMTWPHAFWPNFYKKYKKSIGIISFSRVAFDVERNRALVFVSYACDFTCGNGYFVLLGKEQGRWRVQKTVGVWIS